MTPRQLDYEQSDQYSLHFLSEGIVIRLDIKNICHLNYHCCPVFALIKRLLEGVAASLKVSAG